jgi:hypothetical protein
MNIPTNLKLIESGNIPDTAKLQKGEMAFGRVPSGSKDIRLFVNDNDQWIDEIYTNRYEDITYANLVTEINANGLVSGRKYLITDYQTIYKQPVTNLTMNGSKRLLLLLL